MECVCKKCGMGVEGLTGTKCNKALVKDIVTKHTGEKVQVAECLSG